jgi:hypothetical protein
MTGSLLSSLNTEPPRLPQTMQLVRTGEAPPVQHMPPPSMAWFPEIVQPMRIGELWSQSMPPQVGAEFPEIVQPMSFGEEM